MVGVWSFPGHPSNCSGNHAFHSTGTSSLWVSMTGQGRRFFICRSHPNSCSRIRAIGEETRRACSLGLFCLLVKNVRRPQVANSRSSASSISHCFVAFSKTLFSESYIFFFVHNYFSTGLDQCQIPRCCAIVLFQRSDIITWTRSFVILVKVKIWFVFIKFADGKGEIATTSAVLSWAVKSLSL
jgi:hypothetical protein